MTPSKPSSMLSRFRVLLANVVEMEAERASEEAEAEERRIGLCFPILDFLLSSRVSGRPSFLTHCSVW